MARQIWTFTCIEMYAAIRTMRHPNLEYLFARYTGFDEYYSSDLFGYIWCNAKIWNPQIGRQMSLWIWKKEEGNCISILIGREKSTRDLEHLYRKYKRIWIALFDEYTQPIEYYGGKWWKMETAVEGGAEEHEEEDDEEDDKEGGSRGVGRAVLFYALATIASAAKSAGNRGRAMPPSPSAKKQRWNGFF